MILIWCSCSIAANIWGILSVIKLYSSNVLKYSLVITNKGYKIISGLNVNVRENKNIPYCFKLKKDNDLMYFAGVFENKEFSIITREAEGEHSKIHHRQPIIINKSKINDYLNLKNNAQEVLQSIKPPNLDFYQIGLEINNPKNNYKELINPLQK